jgi:uncharacterized protein YkwD
MDDWLQLTDEDIARANGPQRARPLMPEVIIIRREDVAAAREQPASQGGILTITDADLKAVPPQTAAPADLQALEQLMFTLVNTARGENLPGWLGTTKLVWHTGLAAVARGHAADMLQRQYVAHVSPEGVTAARRIERYGVRYLACGENIGIVYGENSHTRQAIYDIQNAFLNQPRSLTNHRGNLLNPIWTHIGIGVAYNPDGALVATQNFISAPAARLRGQ